MNRTRASDLSCYKGSGCAGLSSSWQLAHMLGDYLIATHQAAYEEKRQKSQHVTSVATADSAARKARLVEMLEADPTVAPLLSVACEASSRGAGGSWGWDEPQHNSTL